MNKSEFSNTFMTCWRCTRHPAVQILFGFVFGLTCGPWSDPRRFLLLLLVYELVLFIMGADWLLRAVATLYYLLGFYIARSLSCVWNYTPVVSKQLPMV